jgi:hypothetical protein
MVFKNSKQAASCDPSSSQTCVYMAFDQIDAGKFSVSYGVESVLILLQYLIWPSVENMNASPEWLMPTVGKQETSPYDLLIDLVPWYVPVLFP